MEIRKNMLGEILCCFVVFVWPGLQYGVGAVCSFPSNLNGIFYSSREGYWTFNSSHFGTMSVSTLSQSYPDLEFECHITSGTYYVARSTTIDIFTSPFYVYMCLDIYNVNANVFYYYYSTAPLVEANGLNIKIVPTTTTVALTSDICDNTVHDVGTYSMLLRNGSNIEETAMECPKIVQGYMQYQFTDSNGNLHCASSSYVDVCTNKAKFAFNYGDCTSKVLYSAGGTLYCLFNMPVSSTMYYVTLYNNDVTVDDSTTYRIVCMLYQVGNKINYATQYPKECPNTTLMTSTSAPSPGGVLLFVTNSTCPVAVDPGLSAELIGGIVGALLFLALIGGTIALVWYFLKKKKTMGKLKTVMPQKELSPVTENAVIIENKPDTNSRTLFTPVPKDSLKLNGVRKVHPVTSLLDADAEKMLSPSSVAVAMSVPLVHRATATPLSLMATSDPDVEVSISEYSDSTETSSPTRMTPTVSGPTPGLTTTDSITASSMTLDSLHTPPPNGY